MLRISPKANQFVLPSPQPLTMLLGGSGYNRRSSRSSTSDADTDYDFKMLPGDKLSYSMALNDLDSRYQNQLNQVFQEGMQSGEGWQSYLRTDSVINELQGFHQDYQTKKIVLDAEKDLLEANLPKYKAQETYFRQEGLTDNDFVFGNDEFGNQQMGLDTPEGRLYTIGAIKNYNASKPFTSQFVNYTQPKFTELDALLKSKMAEATADKTTIKTTSIIDVNKLGQGVSAGGQQKEITETTMRSDKARQLTFAWSSFMSSVYSDPTLERAFEIRRLQYNQQYTSLSDEEQEAIPSFEEFMFTDEVGKKTFFETKTEISDYVDPDDDNGVGSDLPFNYLGDVLYGLGRNIQTRDQKQIFDNVENETIVDYVPQLTVGDDPRAKKVRRLLLDYNNAVTVLISGDKLSDLAVGETLKDVLASNLGEALDKLQFNIETERGQQELRMYLNEYKNEYLERTLTAEDKQEINKYIYGIDPEIASARESGKPIYQQAVSLTNKALEDNTEYKEAGIEKRGDMFRETEAYYTQQLNRVDKVQEPSVSNWEVKDILRYAEITDAYKFPYVEYKNTSLYLKTPTDDILFMGSYISPDKLNDPGKPARPVFIEGQFTYKAMPYKNSKTAGAMVSMIMMNTKENKKNLKFKTSDAVGKIISNNISKKNSKELASMGIVEQTVTDVLLKKLQTRNNYDYKLGDDILIFQVNTPYDEIVGDFLRQVPDSKRTAGFVKDVENYFKGLTNNPTVFD